MQSPTFRRSFITFIFLAPVLISGLAGCSSTPVAYAPQDKVGDSPSGVVPSLRVVLSPDCVPSVPCAKKVRVIFVHGVGDTKTGYAIGQNGWLSDPRAKSIGLFPDSSTIPPARKIYSSVYMHFQNPDKASYVKVLKREYTFHFNVSDSGKTCTYPHCIPVEIIEINWSHLTQWIKTNYLGFDCPSKPICKPTAFDKNNKDSVLAPPGRESINENIKEIFDRGLADTLLYVGSYGPVIERGVAEALCQGLGPKSNPSTQPCQWRDLKDVGNYNYIFVTHSLGSRIVYDLLTNLDGKSTPGRLNPFAGTRGTVNPQITHTAQILLAHTRAIYMMANQLAFLGLSYLPENAMSTSTLYALHTNPTKATYAKKMKAAPAKKIMTTANNTTAGSPICYACNPARVLGQLRALAIRSQAGSHIYSNSPNQPISQPLNIVAFNDTNDVLTWQIPLRYQLGEYPVANVKLVNVFVQNTSHEFVWYENATDAHGFYFINDCVWKIIKDGMNSKTKNVPFCSEPPQPFSTNKPK